MLSRVCASCLSACLQVVEAAPLERKLVVRFPKTPTADSPDHHIDVTYQGQVRHTCVPLAVLLP